MADYQKMYTILVDAVEKVLDGADRILNEGNDRAFPDDEYLPRLKKDLTAAFQRAEEVYIDTSEAP